MSTRTSEEERSISKSKFSLQAQIGDTNLLARAAIIELVLATDMKQHFSILSQFQVYITADACAIMPRAW